ncbi:hypothetical protein NUW54_g647 [Trametes sanguinea]|uniref:Uncharacterized protein n=2 Tax=Trametes sanguinea TaxID=158606 RepID=A0ACC1QAF9_9APHY|nr:hypothetical protein NUW54_g663 [Trametes sanguinea]KAJ3017176.1 hypothetical protein NUW54_g647 [Trametes sanguinea]
MRTTSRYSELGCLGRAQYTWDKRTPAKAWTYYTSSKVYPTELNSAETSKATGQIGHYSSDAKCPQYEKKNTSGDSPQVEGNGGIAEGDNESPVLNNDEVEVIEDDQEYSLSDFGGLQYESEREDNLSPNEDNTNSLLFGGMRIAPFKELLEELVHAHSMAIQPGRNLRHAWLYDAKVYLLIKIRIEVSTYAIKLRKFYITLGCDGEEQSKRVHAYDRREHLEVV